MCSGWVGGRGKEGRKGGLRWSGVVSPDIRADVSVLVTVTSAPYNRNRRRPRQRGGRRERRVSSVGGPKPLSGVWAPKECLWRPRPADAGGGLGRGVPGRWLCGMLSATANADARRFPAGPRQQPKVPGACVASTHAVDSWALSTSVASRASATCETVSSFSSFSNKHHHADAWPGLPERRCFVSTFNNSSSVWRFC